MGAARRRALEALVALQDPENLEFFEGLLRASDKQTARIAAAGIGEVIAHTEWPSSWLSAMPLEYIESVYGLLMWVRLDQPLMPDDPIPVHPKDYAPWEQVDLTCGTYAMWFYAADRRLKLMRMGDPRWFGSYGPEGKLISDPKLETPGVYQAKMHQSVTWQRCGKYLLLELQISQDRPPEGYFRYVFKFDGNAWKPLCRIDQPPEPAE
jgi:hypothetical protein